MSERSAEYISTGWQRMRAEGVAKKDLIEAKTQLAYARIDRYYAHDDAAAKVELAEAKGYLDAAAKRMTAKQKGEVQNLLSLVANLENKLNAGNLSQSDLTAFHHAESSLAALIQQI